MQNDIALVLLTGYILRTRQLHSLGQTVVNSESKTQKPVLLTLRERRWEEGQSLGIVLYFITTVSTE